jgi:apolipoprotein N-acyltransferase
LSFPKFGHPACAWVALAPILLALVPRSHGRLATPKPRRAFQLGLAAGLVYFAGALYWLVDVMVAYGGLPVPIALVVAALLVTYLALYPASFAVVVALLLRRFGLVALVLAPGVWVTTEFLRGWLFTGFPWALVGASQAAFLPVAQLASVTGIYGMSALVVSASAALAWLVAARGGRRAWLPLAVVAATVAVVGWGRARMAEGSLLVQGEPIRVGIVQGNFAQELKWDESLEPVILGRYLRLSADALAQGAQLVVWPESSVPFYFQNDPVRAGRIRELARQGRAHLLVGGDEMEAGSGDADGRARVRLYNAAFLLRPDGQVGAVYRKIHLVPFGEYVPLKRLLFFVSPLVQAVSDFTPGDRVTLLRVGDHAVSTAICYEAIYPELVRRFVSEGSELLTTITNDAWYGRSSAAQQHFELASMRAVEEGRYLVRAANTGISGIIDPYGRVLERTGLFETVVRVREVRFLHARTVYSRVGDIVAYGCAALTIGALLVARRARGRLTEGR